jgi:hypothetical protein
MATLTPPVNTGSVSRSARTSPVMLVSSRIVRNPVVVQIVSDFPVCHIHKLIILVPGSAVSDGFGSEIEFDILYLV